MITFIVSLSNKCRTNAELDLEYVDAKEAFRKHMNYGAF